MKRKILSVIAGLFIIASTANGEPITAQSEPFTFPPLADIKDGGNSTGRTFFKCSGSSMKNGRVTVSWRLPVQIKTSHGFITVYSLLGRVIKTYNVDSKAGNMVLKMDRSGLFNGVSIVRFSFGSYNQTLKIISSK